MARTRKEIYELLVAEKQKIAELDSLTDEETLKEALADLNKPASTSKFGIWRLWLYVVSYALYLQEVIFELHQIEVNKLVDASKVHTAEWYEDKIKQYQHGDPILLHQESKQPYYEVEDDSKKVVKFVAVTGRGVALVKVKGENGKLLDSEAEGVKAYLAEIQEPGAQMGVVNLESDKLILHADLYYSPEFDRLTVESNVQSAVESYIQNLPFNGSLLISDLVEKVKEVEGAEDFYITVMKAKPDIGTSYEDVEARYYPSSGWMELDTYQINVIANV
ncbi:hypothetical protein [Flammeovirga sp. SJP92]|uniref:hypothetical protein n=1 Tax=Flammeovirga sp. SJP92 TaxID=1775430 RepID=UPI00078862F9|nr:hypothetical protein [Flammeovirga sp. SJP92]KXX70769.1 hypothetical protein AVL50_07115 [Flammeovirga sp. SJP92]